LGVKDLTLQNRGLLCKFAAKLQYTWTTNWQWWFQRLYGAAAGRDLGNPHHLDTPT
jgi:hypothetical protein